ncbi:hypothetical protein GCM10007301_25290 [Azorhizobium oxalatiphilum]|uniref:Uncharacterized protein n=1 Tax=Azorhizobium oxalatiphilum TaxID=980631 RepID=A0A917C1L9_9HYPH|nr:hypothetical protein [Azorhizobium oxalatiphilum]GGF64417.1 hypothetical protein GCM10007301_25290 [Azorhizobium oxalatiphilum]
MRNLSYAALALVAGLSLSGAASADEYESQANRDNYAVSAQGHFPGFQSPAFATQNFGNQSLLPTAAQATSNTGRLTTYQQFQAVNPHDEIVGPFSDQDPHSGPSHSGIPSRL